MAKHLVMVVDTKRCINCNTCSMACKVENNLPNDIWWNRCETIGGAHPDSPAGTYPNLSMYNITVACQHCQNAPCVTACPTGATFVDEETGLVRLDAEACIGCQACMTVCPYDARKLIEGEPQWALGFAVGDVDAPVHVANTVGKCTMCWHRVQKGLAPECVEVCPGRARVFGDLNDPESQVSKLLASREYIVLQPEAGTEPSCYYLM